MLGGRYQHRAFPVKLTHTSPTPGPRGPPAGDCRLRTVASDLGKPLVLNPANLTAIGSGTRNTQHE